MTDLIKREEVWAKITQYVSTHQIILLPHIQKLINDIPSVEQDRMTDVLEVSMVEKIQELKNESYAKGFADGKEEGLREARQDRPIKTLQKPKECRNKNCVAMCSPAYAEFWSNNPEKCPNYKRTEQEPCEDADPYQTDMDEAWEQAKRDCSTCKYEHNDGHSQPCRDCGTLLESYTKWEQKESGGKWIKDGYCLKCDVCGYSRTDCDDDGNPIPDNFCPNCGDDKRGWKPPEVKRVSNELDVTIGIIDKPK